MESCTTPVTTEGWTDLATCLAEDGPARHHGLLVELAGRAAVVAPAASEILADEAASDVVRLRAFAVVARALQSERHGRAPVREAPPRLAA